MKVNGIDFCEFVQELSFVDCYDRTIEVHGYDREGKCYSAIADESCGEIVEIYEDSIELINLDK